MPAGELDMIIIGAGITGAGVALDAVTRGLKVAIIEKEDIAFGTSRWSSKLAHGGLRYLAKMELGIAHSSAVERGILLEETAPHLVHSIAQVVPLNDAATTIQQGASRVGFIGGDLLRMAAGTSGDILPHSHYQSVSKTLEMCPGVSRDGLKGSWVFYDGQMIDDARVVTCAIRTAAEKGCLVLTHAACSDVTGTSVTVTDQLGGKSFTLSAKSVVSATGVWAGHIDNEIKLRPARGTHLVIDAAKMGNPTGQLTVPLPGSISRYLFAIPEQLGRIYLGLTAKTDTIDVVLGLESGADDYVTKPFKPKELVARVRARLRSNQEQSSDILTIGNVSINVAAHTVTRDGKYVSLTPLEFDLLTELASKPGRVFTRETLLQHVWGYDHATDSRLINVHVQRLRSKIEEDPENPKIVVTVRGVGYKAGTGN